MSQGEKDDELLKAAMDGSPLAIRRALELGASPWAARPWTQGRPPMSLAARAHGGAGEWRADREGAIAELARVGADPRQADLQGWEALHHAASGFSSAGVISALARAGGDVNALTDDGRTALSLAAERGAFEAARELLRLGAAASPVDHQGLSAQDWARKKAGGQQWFLEELIRREAQELTEITERPRAPEALKTPSGKRL